MIRLERRLGLERVEEVEEKWSKNAVECLHLDLIRAQWIPHIAVHVSQSCKQQESADGNVNHCVPHNDADENMSAIDGLQGSFVKTNLTLTFHPE